MIGLHEPYIAGNEWKYVKECLDTGWVSSAGSYVSKFEKNIAKYTGSKYAVAFVNGTSALQLGLKLAGVISDDEVIVPSITFIAPINAVKYNLANPIFMDSDNFFNIDIDKTIDFIDNQTIFKNGHTYNKLTKKRISAIIPVHIFGNAVYLDELNDVCKERNIKIVEDASESLGSFYKNGRFKNKHTGTIGVLGCLSFNGNKIITSGGGGMIITDDFKIAEKAKYLSEQAKDNPVKYIHNEIGYNFRLTNIQAAIGLAQLEKINHYLKRKRVIFDIYSKELSSIDGAKINSTPDYSINNHWLNSISIDQRKLDKNCDTLISMYQSNKIQTRPIWYPNHLQKPYNKSQSYNITRANNLVDKTLCIPSGMNLKDKDISNIISLLK
jgi:perosamine synthetase